MMNMSRFPYNDSLSNNHNSSECNSSQTNRTIYYNSQADNLVDVCSGTMFDCGRPVWEEIYDVMNVVSIAINIIHLSVLNELQSGTARGHISSYHKLLKQLAGVDIAYAIASCMKMCVFRRLLIGSEKIWGALVSGLTDWPSPVRYYTLALACYDRCVAIRWPLHHSSNRLILNVNTAHVVLWLIALLLTGVREYIFRDSVCIDGISGATTYFGSFTAATVYYCTLTPATIIIIVCMFISLAELKKMISTPITQVPQAQREVQRATVFTVANSILFLFCLFPGIIGSFQYALKIDVDFSVAYLGYALYLAYGIMNTLLYGWINKKYRATIVKMFCPKCQSRIDQY